MSEARATARQMAYGPALYEAFRALLAKTDCTDYTYLEVYMGENLLAEIDEREIPYPHILEDE